MLLVDATAGPSPIHGRGLFAREPIAAGTLIWKLEPAFDVVMTRRQVDALSPAAGEQVRPFIYVDLATGLYVLCSDDARYMNHSDAPNTRTEGSCTWALVDIAPGTELTADYAQFDAPSRQRVEACADNRISTMPGETTQEPDSITRRSR